MKKLPIRKPKNRMERITWSCLAAIALTYIVVMLVLIGLTML